MENTSKIKSFKIYTDDTDEEKVLVGNDIDTALEIMVTLQKWNTNNE